MEINDVLEIIDRYYAQYNLPKFNVTEGEIDAMLSTLGNLNDIVPAMNLIIRRAINFALTDNCQQINLYYFICALDDLAVFNISEENIEKFKYQIMLNGLKNNAEKVYTKTK